MAFIATRDADRALRAAVRLASPAFRAASIRGEIENDEAADCSTGSASGAAVRRGGRLLTCSRAHLTATFAAAMRASCRASASCVASSYGDLPAAMMCMFVVESRGAKYGKCKKRAARISRFMRKLFAAR